MLIDLPLRKKELEVPVQDGRVVLVLATLDDEAAGELWDCLETVDGRTRVNLPSYTAIRIFDRHIRAARTAGGEPIRIGGAPFDVANRDHVRSLHKQWKIDAVTTAALYEFHMPEDLAGNSSAPVEH